MTFNYKYSLGVYVNRHFASSGGEGNPHVFLGLKREKMKCNEMQIQMQKDIYQHYLKHNMAEQANQCKINIEQMQCFKQESTLEDLRKELSEKYHYTFANDKNFKAWKDTILNPNDSSNKDFDKALRETFNNDFAFLRQCYADITEPFFEWVKHIKNIDDDYLKTKMSFDEFETLFNEFIESQYSNLDSLEGFFGFGPYETKFFNNYKKDKYNTGGKVFQNNHWNDESKEKAQDDQQDNQDKYAKLKEELKDNPLPRLPLNPKDKDLFAYSPEHCLTIMRPLKTFQEHQSEVMAISENQYKELAKSLLFQTLLSSYDIRHNQIIFGDTRNEFKNYKVVGNSCVSFVKDKLKIIFGNKLDWWDKMTWTPQGAYDVIKKHSKRFNAQELSIAQSLLDIELFYQNYATLCSIDSSWECEKGLKAFGKYYNGILHSALLNDTKANRLGKNKIDLLSRNADIEHIADDISMRLNTHFCVYCYFQDAIDYNLKESKISLLILDENKRFLKADESNDFAFRDFNFADMNDKTIQALSLSMYHQQPIIFHDISNHNICKLNEHYGMYIQTFVEHFAGLDKSIGDYRHSLQSKDVRYA